MNNYQKSVLRKEIENLEILCNQMNGAALHASTPEKREFYQQQAKEISEKIKVSRKTLIEARRK